MCDEQLCVRDVMFGNVLRDLMVGVCVMCVFDEQVCVCVMVGVCVCVCVCV